MIARIWTARTTHANAPAYAEYLRTHVFSQLRDIDGYDHALLLQRDTGAGDAAKDVEVLVVTFWRSLDAIRAFAGPEAETAVVTDRASALLTDFERRVSHFDVVLRDSA